MSRHVIAAALAAALCSNLLGYGPTRNSRRRLVQHGLASFYDDSFSGRVTASGERFSQYKYVAAHPTYPVGTIVRVTNLANGRSVTVRIIDRGPSDKNRFDGVIIDLSRSAAEQLGFTKKGRTRVRTQVLKWGNEGQSGTG